MQPTENLNIEAFETLPTPEEVHDRLPLTEAAARTVVEGRRALERILDRKDPRLFVVVGPCSIHDPGAAMAYAGRLALQRERLGADLELVMRVYFEKPRTTVGWKGLINDPYLNGSFRINEGLRIARDLLVRINREGVPAAGEFLDTISPQYLGDLVSWGAIGARTTESQVHRELASGLSAPIGFKNGTDGEVRIAVDAILAAQQRHHFLSVHKNGQVAIVETKGNPDCHIILRGGKAPNYGPADVEAASRVLREAGLEPRIMIDFSHANCHKDPARQTEVCEAVAKQIAGGDRRIMGVMVESHLQGGRQDLKPGKSLVYGQSITDGCISWEDTVPMLDALAAAVRKRRKKAN